VNATFAGRNSGARHLSQALNESGDQKFGILPGELSWKAGKLGLHDPAFRRLNELESDDFVGNAAIRRREGQSGSDVLGGGRDLEEQSHFAWIGFHSEVQPSFAIAEHFRRAFKKLALRHGGDATVAILRVTFQTPARFTKEATRMLCLRSKTIARRAANPVALGKTTRLVSSATFNARSLRAAAIDKPISSHAKAPSSVTRQTKAPAHLRKRLQAERQFVGLK